MKTVGEPEEIRIPREDERPEILPVEEPVPELAGCTTRFLLLSFSSDWRFGTRHSERLKG